MEEGGEITERYNRATGFIEICCRRCANAEELPTRRRKRHEYALYLPEWIEATKPSRFARGSGGDCTQRGLVVHNELVCLECGNMSTAGD